MHFHSEQDRTRSSRKGRDTASTLVMSLKSILGPLPDLLRIGVYDSYEKPLYRQFMQRVVALQEGTMSLEVADNDVFAILGYDGGKMNRDPGYQPFRDASSKSHRPDLYRMFVEWSTEEPAVVAKKKKHNNVPFSFGVMRMGESHKLEIDAVTKNLAQLLRKPLLSLLSGAEPGEELNELDRWWTLDGVSSVSVDQLKDISECFSTLAKLRSTR